MKGVTEEQYVIRPQWILVNLSGELLCCSHDQGENEFVKLVIVLLFGGGRTATQCKGLLSTLWKLLNISEAFSLLTCWLVLFPSCPEGLHSGKGGVLMFQDAKIYS